MIKVRDLHINQGDFILKQITFNLSEGEYVVLMGKTGSGKSTILEVICGLRNIEHGEIFLGDKVITSLDPGQRQIGYVPQDGALFSHMSVMGNIAFPLKLRKWPKASIKTRVNELADELGILNLLNRSTTNLSGGEIQRVALARALSFKPSVLCLDEPLSALDDETKEDMISVLKVLQRKHKVTMLHVSHSRIEAERLADRVLHMDELCGQQRER
ncbi:ABC transporter ATP-binding protein [Portibacter marinus]|uniref:ABC transporter ATP-binding protein n=1 Tax=Portibacter marinus TaxID=2898660 RepID=UPI001F3332A0|nr:ATP-binding cassette domain-containing protein [Portibacter marinus]